MPWPWRFTSRVYEACVGQWCSAIKGNSIARQHRSVVVWSLWIKVVEERNAEQQFNWIQFSMHCWATPRIVTVWSCSWKRSKRIVCYRAQPGGPLPARAFTLTRIHLSETTFKFMHNSMCPNLENSHCGCMQAKRTITQTEKVCSRKIWVQFVGQPSNFFSPPHASQRHLQGFKRCMQLYGLLLKRSPLELPFPPFDVDFFCDKTTWTGLQAARQMRRLSALFFRHAPPLYRDSNAPKM